MPELYHYYERGRGAFRSLSGLPVEEAEALLDSIRRDGRTFAAGRDAGYLRRRAELEALVREQFCQMGGLPQRRTPHYLVVGRCDWLLSWYEEGAFVRIPLSVVAPESVSFTYGDMFPTFSPRVADGKEYRGRIYTLAQLPALIERYGLPQDWNPEGKLGPERYIEAQLWSDKPLRGLRNLD